MMLKWFSISGIINEVKRIRWASPKDLLKNSTTVIGFMTVFAIFFVICTMFNAMFLSLLGV